MPELLKRQIERLETAIDLSSDWLEIQYLMAELDQLKALYDEKESDAAWMKDLLEKILTRRSQVTEQ